MFTIIILDTVLFPEKLKFFYILLSLYTVHNLGISFFLFCFIVVVFIPRSFFFPF